MDITFTINGTTVTATGNPDELAAYTRNITFTISDQPIDDAADNLNGQTNLGNWSAFDRYGHTTIHRAGCECEPEGRLFHTEIGVTLSASALTIRNEGAPGIIGTADCCY